MSDQIILAKFNDDELQALLDHAGSWKRFWEIVGLHDSRQRVNFSRERPLIRTSKLHNWTKSQLHGELQRIGSTFLFCILKRCKESELRSRAKELEIDLKILCQPIGSNSGTGRKGENYFKQIRGQMIMEDCYEVRGHTSPFDFRDLVYGLVNVKTACRQRYSAKTRATDPNYWHFSTKGWKDCDYLALVPLSPAGEPQMIIMIQAQVIGPYFPTHIILTGKDLKAGYISTCQNDRSQLDSAREYILLSDLFLRARNL